MTRNLGPKMVVRALGTVALLTSGSAALAQDRAVERTHFELAVASVENDTSNSTSSGAIGADLTATFPIGRYFGASLGGGYTRSRVRTRDSLEDENGELPGDRPTCSFDSLVGEASLFFRIPSIGRISAAYDIGDLSASCDGVVLFPVSGDDSLSTDGYRVDAELYLGDFTLGAEHATTKLGDGPEVEATTLAASWYPIESVKIELYGNDLYDEDTYGLKLEHQPEMFGEGLGVRFGFSMNDASPRSRTFELGVSYYFGRKVSLQSRDRQYR
jgi:hypothetical protein